MKNKTADEIPPEIKRPEISVFFNRLPEASAGKKSFTLLFLKSGTAKISAGGNDFSLIGPACLCGNETEHISIEPSPESPYAAVIFEPVAVNSVLTIENLRRNKTDLSLSEKQDRDYLRPFILRDDDHSGIIQLDWDVSEKIFTLIKRLDAELTGKCDGFWPCRSRSHLLELLFLLFTIHHDGKPAMSYQIDSSLSGRIIHYIHSRYSDKISLPELCRLFETNKTTVSAEIKKATGLTVVDFTNKIRVHNACLLLRGTGLPVQEIMYRTGFNDTAHFGRVFKKFVKMPPSMYRTTYSQFKNKAE